jgi:hypothetical protein
MAHLNEMDVSYSRKVQLDQFEPVEHSVEMSVTVEDGDDPDAVYDEFADRAEEMVERAIAKRVASKKLEADDDTDE